MKDIKPIRTYADLKAALDEINRLWNSKRGTPEGDRLEVLGVLVEAYEKKRYPIDPPTPIEAIEFRLEQMGLDREALEPMIGSRNRVREVLSGKRDLTLPMIRRLSAGLGIPIDTLVGPTIRQKSRTTRQDAVGRSAKTSK
jgi:HTH-type transcriptional regulator/antitoxin HigA